MDGRGQTTTIHVRGVPADALEVMRTRAEAEGMSLTAYLRRMVVEAAAQPTVAEVLARAAKRSPAGLTMADIVAANSSGRTGPPSRSIRTDLRGRGR